MMIATDRIEIDVHRNRIALRFVHGIEVLLRSRQRPFFGAEQADAKPSRRRSQVRSHGARDGERSSDTGRIVHRAFREIMSVDVSAQNDPLRALSRQVER
jgi:hypothetical protein